jgi:hypothetical protein
MEMEPGASNERAPERGPVRLFAVGATPEEALAHMGKELGWGELSALAYDEPDHDDAWYARFTADGTSMKAAGEYVTGGAIVTWWK